MHSADFYKSSGVITMEIQKFSEFAKGDKNEVYQFSDDPIYICGLPWNISASPYMPAIDLFPRGLSPQKCLNFFLYCNEENEDTNWGCHASVILKVLSQQEGKEDFVREFQHVFHANGKDNEWGYPRFMALEYLMDPENGWYDVTSDSIKLSVEINANIPYGIEWPYGISEDIGNLFDKGDEYSDCILVAEGKEFKVYKGILASRSPVFAGMFQHGMVEAQNGIVKIEDIKSEVLEQMLRFIYTGMKPNMEKMAEELLIAAERYQISQLKMICECELAISLNNENVCELLILANIHSAEILKAQAIDYIGNQEHAHAKEVMKTEGWKMLIQGNYGELLDLILKAIMAEKN